MKAEAQNLKNPLVSVIVATYHRDRELHEAVLSLMHQTYKNTEIIVVDDNADKFWNEKVSNILERLNKEFDKNILYIANHENNGSARTRNVGIENASGEYITFLDDDDTYLPEKIEEQLKDFQMHKADYGLTDLYIYDDKDNIIDKRIRSYIKSTKTDELLRYHMMYHMTGTDTFMFRAEYIRKIGGFPLVDVGDEYYLMKEAILSEGKFLYSPHCYVKAYIHTGEKSGLSSGSGKIYGENILFKEKQKYFDRLKAKDVRYIKSRHFAVLAFAEYRRHSYGAFVYYVAKALISSPGGCIKILSQHKT